jgi:hypothetical protein
MVSTRRSPQKTTRPTGVPTLSGQAHVRAERAEQRSWGVQGWWRLRRATTTRRWGGADATIKSRRRLRRRRRGTDGGRWCLMAVVDDEDGGRCRLRGVMGVQRCRGGSGGASVGRRRWLIFVGGASAAPSDTRGVGCGVSGSTSAGRWWRRCRGGGRWQRIPGLAVASWLCWGVGGGALGTTRQPT